MAICTDNSLSGHFPMPSRKYSCDLGQHQVHSLRHHCSEGYDHPFLQHLVLVGPNDCPCHIEVVADGDDDRVLDEPADGKGQKDGLHPDCTYLRRVRILAEDARRDEEHLDVAKDYQGERTSPWKDSPEEY